MVEGNSANDIYIVVDVIRATTSMAVMFDQGAARVLVAGSIEQAREAAQKIPGRLLCGERNVQRIPASTMATRLCSSRSLTWAGAS